MNLIKIDIYATYNVFITILNTIMPQAILNETSKSIEEIELITDLADYIRVIFDEIYKAIYFDKKRLEILEKNFKERIKSVIIYFDSTISYNILIDLIDIFNDKIKQGAHPWSYKDMLRNLHWISNVLASFEPNITIEIYKFACMIGSYNLIKRAFIFGIDPNYNFESLTSFKQGCILHDFSCNGFYYVQLTMIIKSEEVRIYKLFLEHGFNIKNLLNIVNEGPNWPENNLHRALAHSIELAELMFISGCGVCESTLYILSGWIGFKNPKKMKNKNRLKFLVNTIINKTLEKYGTLDTVINNYGRLNLVNSPLFKLCNTLVTYHNEASYKFVNKWYIINKETIIEYFIKKLLLNGANTKVLDNFRYGLFQDQQERMVNNNIQKMLKNIIVPRKDAIKYVKDVSNYLLPDIANIVFDYAHNFNCKTHYSLANEVYK